MIRETFSFSFFNFSFSFFDSNFGPVTSGSSVPSAGAASRSSSCLVGSEAICAGYVSVENTSVVGKGAQIDALVSWMSSSSSFATFLPLAFLPFLGFVFVGPNSSSRRSSGSISAGFLGALMSPLALAASVSEP